MRLAKKKELEIASQIKKHTETEIRRLQEILKQNMLDETKLILKFSLKLDIERLANIKEKIKKLKGEQNA